MVRDHDWSLLINSSPPHVIYEDFIEQMGTFLKQFQRLVISKRRKKLDWLAAEVMQAISHRDWLWHHSKRSPKNVALRLESRSATNRTVALMRAAKRRYLQQQLKDSARNSRKT